MHTSEKDSKESSNSFPPEVIPPDQMYDLLVAAFKKVLTDSKVHPQRHLSEHPLSENPLTERQAAEKIGLQPQTLTVWRCKGIGLPYIKIGRSVRYRQQDIDEYIEQHLVQTSKKGGTK